MSKGTHGETCTEAIRASIHLGEVVTYSVLYKRVREKGDWTEATIRRHLMSCIVNLPPARYEWERIRPFLFLHEDGTYEIYNPGVHPAVRE